MNRGFEAMELYRTAGVSVHPKFPTVTLTEEQKEFEANIMDPSRYICQRKTSPCFITGDRDIAEWNQFVQEVMDMGAQQIVDLYNGENKQLIR